MIQISANINYKTELNLLTKRLSIFNNKIEQEWPNLNIEILKLKMEKLFNLKVNFSLKK